jgi:hypothetical protein
MKTNKPDALPFCLLPALHASVTILELKVGSQNGNCALKTVAKRLLLAPKIRYVICIPHDPEFFYGPHRQHPMHIASDFRCNLDLKKNSNFTTK